MGALIAGIVVDAVDGNVLGCWPVRAVTIQDESLSVEEHPDPEPGAGELLVRVRLAGARVTSAQDLAD